MLSNVCEWRQFTSTDPEDEAAKSREEEYGDFEIVRSEYRYTHRWTVQVDEALSAPAEGTRRTSGRERSVGSFGWSPGGRSIAFSATRMPDLVDSGTSDIYVLRLEGDEVTLLVTQPGPDTSPRWSPDGQSLVFNLLAGLTGRCHARWQAGALN